MDKDELQRLHEDVEATAARVRKQAKESKQLVETSKRHIEQTKKTIRAINAKKPSE